jgi:hypothetical protein
LSCGSGFICAARSLRLLWRRRDKSEQHPVDRPQRRVYDVNCLHSHQVGDFCGAKEGKKNARDVSKANAAGKLRVQWGTAAASTTHRGHDSSADLNPPHEAVSRVRNVEDLLMGTIDVETEAIGRGELRGSTNAVCVPSNA